MMSNPNVSTGQKPSRQLMQGGEWLVPEDERPRGWEKMGVREPPAAVMPGLPKVKETAAEPAAAVPAKAPDIIRPESKPVQAEPARHRGGRRKATFDRARVQELLRAGHEVSEVATKLGLARVTIHDVMRDTDGVPPCACGRPKGHTMMCSARAQARVAKKRQRREAANAAQLAESKASRKKPDPGDLEVLRLKKASAEVAREEAESMDRCDPIDQEFAGFDTPALRAAVETAIPFFATGVVLPDVSASADLSGVHEQLRNNPPEFAKADTMDCLAAVEARIVEAAMRAYSCFGSAPNGAALLSIWLVCEELSRRRRAMETATAIVVRWLEKEDEEFRCIESVPAAKRFTDEWDADALRTMIHEELYRAMVERA